jgi:hypothetical protein
MTLSPPDWLPGLLFLVGYSCLIAAIIHDESGPFWVSILMLFIAWCLV